ncbi:MAG: endonuclease/exonuclease/phosphatase family protein [Phycisphaerales bacterium]
MWTVHFFWYLGSGAVVVSTALSMLRHSIWWIRIWDFPRIQILLLGVLMLTLGAWLGIRSGIQADTLHPAWIVTTLLLILATLHQASWAIRMTPLTKPEVGSAADHEADRIRIIASNVDYTNSQREASIKVFRGLGPDLLALLEVDDDWESVIQAQSDQFPFSVTEYKSEGRGIALLSRFPLHDTEVKYLVLDDRPSIWGTLRMSDLGSPSAGDEGDEMIGVCVLHPPPPGLEKRNKDERVSSKPRDVELAVAARMIHDSEIKHWMMIGDFNDVGWSHTTEDAKRIGRLLDPRIGRGFFNTFPARKPLLRYPIDHVLVTESFTVSRLSCLEDIGSDHLPLLADLHLSKQGSGSM